MQNSRVRGKINFIDAIHVQGWCEKFARIRLSFLFAFPRTVYRFGLRLAMPKISIQKLEFFVHRAIDRTKYLTARMKFTVNTDKVGIFHIGIWNLYTHPELKAFSLRKYLLKGDEKRYSFSILSVFSPAPSYLTVMRSDYYQFVDLRGPSSIHRMF